jgi:hypothetical protein
MLAEAEARKSELRAAIAALTASPQAAPEGGELSDCDVLAHWLDSQGFHGEAQNVRNGIDHESYEDELRLIEFARNFKTASPQVQGGEADMPPEGQALAWIESAYRGDSFTKWNMEVAYTAGWQARGKATPQSAPGVPYDVARRALHDAYQAGRNGTGYTSMLDSLIDALAAPVSAVGVDDDKIIELARKHFLPHNRSAYDALTFERSPAYIPQATYDVPTVEFTNFVKAVAALASGPSGVDGLVGELVQMGDDEDGNPRLVIHTTREAIKAARLPMFRSVSVATIVRAAAPAAQDQGEGNAR